MTATEWTFEPATSVSDAMWMMASGDFYILETAPGTFTVNRTDGYEFVEICTLYDLDGAKQAAKLARTIYRLPTIHADGSITDGAAAVAARIVGTSPRELVADGLRIDVTHAWHSPALSAVVAALLAGQPLPAGFHMRTRRDGVAMVGVDRQ